MVIDNFFIQYKKPAQYIYWGENHLDIYRVPASDKIYKKVETIDNVSLSELKADEFRDIAGELAEVDTGIVLNSGHFIFNIFEFEKIPFQEALKKDLVEWRLKKVFPENIDDYEHDFFKLNRTRILSILFKKSLKKKIEDLFDENKIALVYLGNSTVEMMNHMAQLRRSAPDFFIEIDKSLSLSTVVFLSQGVPFYIRKFRSERAADVAGEVVKTINFVKNSYTEVAVPRTYSLAADYSRPGADFHAIGAELAKLDILELALKDRERLFFLGKNDEHQV